MEGYIIEFENDSFKKDILNHLTQPERSRKV